MSTPYYAGTHAYSFKFNNGGNPLANVEAGEDSRVRTDPQARTEVFNVWGTLYIALEMYERWDKKMEFIDQSTGETFFRTHNQITKVMVIL